MEMETPDFSAIVSSLMDGKVTELQTFLTPVLVLVCWTLIMWLWMYATRIPAMQKAGIDPGKIQQKGELDVLPIEVRRVADNYNHLHEQPVIFYALAFYSHLAGTADSFAIGLAWGYVLIRVVHSLWQCLINYVPARFFIFLAGSILLIILAIKNLLALF